MSSQREGEERAGLRHAGAGERAPPSEREDLADQQLRGDPRAQQYLDECSCAFTTGAFDTAGGERIFSAEAARPPRAHKRETRSTARFPLR